MLKGAEVFTLFIQFPGIQFPFIVHMSLKLLPEDAACWTLDGVDSLTTGGESGLALVCHVPGGREWVQ